MLGARYAVAVATALAVAGCGGDDRAEQDEAPPPPATAAASPTAPALDETALVAVRDALAECLAGGDVGIVVEYEDGKAAAGSGKVETGLAAPEATKAAIEEGAQYVGLRDDQRADGLTPNWDILVFADEEAAKAAYVPLSDEVGDPSGAIQAGRHVIVRRPEADADGDDPEAAEARLAECQQQAEGAG